MNGAPSAGAHSRHEIRILRLATSQRGKAAVHRFKVERLGLLLLVAVTIRALHR
jgi:hypothetical protein